MPVPAAFERARVALPDAQAAGVLRHLEQLGQALVFSAQAYELGPRAAQLVVRYSFGCHDSTA
jgi:hypothetical protein